MASPWYASGFFWTVFAALTAVAAIVVSVWATRRYATPKRSLVYQAERITPLVNGDPGVRSKIEISASGATLSDPHLVEALVFSRSRADIPSALFDSGRPFKLDVAARIIEVIQFDSSPASYARPDLKVDGSVLAIGPNLIKADQRLAITLLVDGPKPKLTCPDPPLIDVLVHGHGPTSPEELKPWLLAEVVAWCACLTIALPVALVSALRPDPTVANNPDLMQLMYYGESLSRNLGWDESALLAIGVSFAWGFVATITIRIIRAFIRKKMSG